MLRALNFHNPRVDDFTAPFRGEGEGLPEVRRSEASSRKAPGAVLGAPPPSRDHHVLPLSPCATWHGEWVPARKAGDASRSQ